VVLLHQLARNVCVVPHRIDYTEEEIVSGTTWLVIADSSGVSASFKRNWRYVLRVD
jgi:hypothetical protein